VLEVLYHRAKFGGARISPAAGAAKNVEVFFVTGSTARSASRRYLIYSEADFELFCNMLHRWGCNWHGGHAGGDLRVPSSMPNFIPIGATTRV